MPPGKPEVSVAITIQYIAPDFTALGSFGSATDFATVGVGVMCAAVLGCSRSGLSSSAA